MCKRVSFLTDDDSWLDALNDSYSQNGFGWGHIHFLLYAGSGGEYKIRRVYRYERVPFIFEFISDYVIILLCLYFE